MLNTPVISAKELRDNIAEILEKVAIGKQSFIVAKFGKVKAMISPVVSSIVEENRKEKEIILKETFGIWKKRKDIKNTAKWVSDKRKKESSRYAKVFD